MEDGPVTLDQVAREAGVSLATADRVLNRRPGVRPATAARVEATVARLGYRPDPLAARLSRRQVHRLCFVLPGGSNPFMRMLEAQVRQTGEWLHGQRVRIDIVHEDVFDPEKLARRLETIGAPHHGVATVALDHPRVRAAIADLTERGLPVVTLVSDSPASSRLRFVGIDNIAAGRTAGSLMGRFCAARPGQVAVLAGSLLLRDHADRHLGFAQVLSGEYPNLVVLPVEEVRDDSSKAEATATALLARHPDLVGLYSIGAGNEGIGAALERSGRAGSVVFVGHELSPPSRRLLLHGVMDACINQDAGHESRSAARILVAQCSGEAILPDQERIRIDIVMRDNCP